MVPGACPPVASAPRLHSSPPLAPPPQLFCTPGQEAECGPTHPPPPPVFRYRYGGAAGLCMGTNASFPCPGGHGNSCPLFLVDCADPTAEWAQAGAGGTSLESVAHPGQCINIDCDSCAAHSIGKITDCAQASGFAFDAAAGALAGSACSCLNGGQGAAVPPCTRGEQVAVGQLQIDACGGPTTAGVWSQEAVARPRWHGSRAGGSGLPHHWHWRDL